MKALSFTVDKNLRIRSWSDDLQMLTGADASQALGKKYTLVFPPFLMHDKEAVGEVLKKRRTVNLKQCQFRCLSHYREADIKITPVRNSNGSGHHVQIVLAPSEPCSVGQQLIDSQKLIAIGKIAAMLAHGVRNPLNAIKGAVVYLRERYSHEKPMFEFMEILEEEISRLENFISRFLTTTTFDSDVSLVDINQLVQKIKVFISLQTHTHDIRCEYVLGDIPPIEISSFHLEQALLNVINNSIEAMTSGGTITIRTALRSCSPVSCVAIEISDTGAGVDLSSRPTNLDQRIKGQGRGFGLFIADEIIKYYKGHLKIHGEKGKGTTVTFLLPVKKIIEGDSL
jgi:two-component system, NtrC family, nitrogen regulation sensor histidine kinase GlnL